jgi:integrase
MRFEEKIQAGVPGGSAGAGVRTLVGVPHSDIQRLLGHKNLTTTQRYLLSGRSGVPKNLPTPI